MGARKCAVCKAHQDWRRFLTFGNTSLSLLVALISVSAVAIPLIKEAFTPKYERVTARVISQRFEESLGKHALVILASNDGTVPAFLDPNATLFARKRTEAFGVNLLPSVKDSRPREAADVAGLMLQPATQRVLFATLPEAAPTIKDPDPDTDCELSVTVHTLSGTSRSETHAYRCFDWNRLPVTE